MSLDVAMRTFGDEALNDPDVGASRSKMALPRKR